MLERDAREGKPRVDTAAEAQRELCDAEHCPFLGLDCCCDSSDFDFDFFWVLGGLFLGAVLIRSDQLSPTTSFIIYLILLRAHAHVY